MTDIALIRRWREVGDAQAFNEIASLYAPMVYGACMRILRNTHDAQDAAQDCFLTLSQTRKLPRDHFPAWLHVVAANCARKRLRAEGRRRERESLFAAGAEKYSEATWDEISAYIDEAIAALDPDLRSLVVSHFLQGQSQTEIANKLGLSRQTVTHRIGRATEQIRASLKKKGLITSTSALAAHIAANTAEAVPAPLAEAIGKIALAGPSMAGVTATGWLGAFVAAKAFWAAAACTVVIASIATYFLYSSIDPEQLEGRQTTTVEIANLAPESSATRHPTQKMPINTVRLATLANSSASGNATTDNTPPVSSSASERGLVSGVVELPNGEAFVGANVRLESNERNASETAQRTTTDGDGSFEFQKIAAGTYGIQVTEPGAMVSGKGFELVEITIDENESITDLRLVYGTEGNLSIDGHVVDTKNNPIPGVSVGILSPINRSVITDANGKFHLRYLPAGKYQISADKYGAKYSYAGLLANAGDTNVTIVMKGLGQVEGRVVRADTGQPIKNFEAAFMNGHTQTMRDDLFSNTKEFDDPMGRFLLTDVYVGDLTIAARADGFVPSFVHAVLDENETISDIEIRLEPGNPTIIRGHVVAADGSPILGAVVYSGAATFRDIINKPQHNRQIAYTDESGAFSFSDKTQLSAVLSAFHTDFAPGSTRVSPDTVITLEQAATVRAIVKNEGQPANKIQVYVWNRPEVRLDYISSGLTNADGLAFVKDLVPGPVRVEARMSTDRSLMKEVTLAAGETTEAQFDFVSATAAISGRITVLGEAPPSAEVRLYVNTDAGAEVIKTYTKADGSYDFTEIPAGAATLFVNAWSEIGSWNRCVRRYNIPLVSQNATTLDIDLAGTAQAQGRVVNPKYPEVHVYVLEGQFTFEEAKSELARGDDSIFVARFVRMQDGGSFNVENLEPGTYTFVAAYRSQADWDIREFFASTTATVQNGSVTEVQLTAQP